MQTTLLFGHIRSSGNDEKANDENAVQIRFQRPRKSASVEELLLLSQAGEYGALEELMSRTRWAIYKRALVLTKNSSDTEDVAAEALLRIYRRVSSKVTPESGSPGLIQETHSATSRTDELNTRVRRRKKCRCSRNSMSLSIVNINV